MKMNTAQQQFFVNLNGKTLSKYFPGVLDDDVDFKLILIDYMVENGLKFVQDVDWKALTKLPQFRGLNITFYYVSSIILIFSRNHNSLSHKRAPLCIKKCFQEVQSDQGPGHC